MEWLIPYKLDTDAPDGGRPSIQALSAPEKRPDAARHRSAWTRVRALFFPTPMRAPCSRS